MDFTKFASIKSPPSDDGLKVLQLIASDKQQEQQVTEHADLYIFAFSPETDQQGDEDG
ncbi:MAG: hypothetical protein ACLUIO_00915 [Neglectibacter timonensis]